MSNTPQTHGLIGGTGFVGGSLMGQHTFTHTFNSQTIADAYGMHFDLLVSAAPSAVKWKANAAPVEDRAMVEAYMADLGKIKADFVVVISTCDVYETPRGVDEATPIAPTLETLHAYGKHRFMLEEYIRTQFPNHLIVRLPALFGEGLKKNALYDLMHNNQLEKIHHAGSFQFYNLMHLWEDIERARNTGITLLNITSEPVTIEEIARVCFGVSFTNVPPSAPASYDIRSVHAPVFGGSDGYLYTKEKVLAEMKEFVHAHKE